MLINILTNNFNVANFVNELANVSKNLGILEAKIDSYQFDGILLPMLQKKSDIINVHRGNADHHY